MEMPRVDRIGRQETILTWLIYGAGVFMLAVGLAAWRGYDEPAGHWWILGALGYFALAVVYARWQARKAWAAAPADEVDTDEVDNEE